MAKNKKSKARFANSVTRSGRPIRTNLNNEIAPVVSTVNPITVSFLSIAAELSTSESGAPLSGTADLVASPVSLLGVALRLMSVGLMSTSHLFLNLPLCRSKQVTWPPPVLVIPTLFPNASNVFVKMSISNLLCQPKNCLLFQLKMCMLSGLHFPPPFLDIQDLIPLESSKPPWMIRSLL